MSANISPSGSEWFCMMCGKTSVDLHGDAGSSWDESCMLNSVLVNKGEQPSALQAKEFGDERERYIAESSARFKAMLADFSKKDPLEDDPEIIAAVKAAAKRIESRTAPTGQDQRAGTP